MQCINTQLVFLCNSALTWPPWLPNHPTWVVQTTEHIEAESACLAVPNQVYPPIHTCPVRRVAFWLYAPGAPYDEEL